MASQKVDLRRWAASFVRRCGIPVSTPHSSGLARLASGAFYIAIQILTFYETITFPPKNIPQDYKDGSL
jgi:hypothetical protein